MISFFVVHAVIERRLKELEEDRKKLDKELRNARMKVSSSEQNKEILEAKLKVCIVHFLMKISWITVSAEKISDR